MGDLDPVIESIINYTTLPDKFINELDTMTCILESPEEFRKLRMEFVEKWLEEHADKPIKLEMVHKSSEYRKKAVTAENKFDGERNIIEACRLYTEAILEAPANSQTLGLAYAGRANMLEEFGYYHQAYDDWQCVLDEGCTLQTDVVMKQTRLAFKLNNYELAKKHLEMLQTMELSEIHKSEINNMYEKLENSTMSSIDVAEIAKMISKTESQNIVDSKDVKGRFMVASRSIQKDEVIFIERASSFVPVCNKRMCHQCASLQFIPYPCSKCFGRVLYCSIKCRKAHANIHKYECAGYQYKLFDHVGLGHLAMRMMLEGLPTVLKDLQRHDNTKAIWLQLAAGNVPADREYRWSLKMITHLKKMNLDNVLWYSAMSYILIHYLKYSTTFFDDLQKKITRISTINWEYIIAALILRHIGQLISNGHLCSALMTTSNEFILLKSDGVWKAPKHLECGKLYIFSCIQEFASANYPYLSLCNHSCNPTIRSRFNGRCLTALSRRSIRLGEEIYNCYSNDCRNGSFEARSETLEEDYFFKCKCNKCQSEDPNQDFINFHRYRCEICSEIFVPFIKHIYWWRLNFDSIECTKCKRKQNFEFNKKLNDQLDNIGRSADTRKSLFTLFDKLSYTLIDYNAFRCYIAYHIVTECSAALTAGTKLTRDEIGKIVKINEYLLRCIVEQNGLVTLQYVGSMTFLWDIIARGRYTYKRSDMNNMLDALKILPDEQHDVFLNYYNDYIEDKLID